MDIRIPITEQDKAIKNDTDMTWPDILKLGLYVIKHKLHNIVYDAIMYCPECGGRLSEDGNCHNHGRHE